MSNESVLKTEGPHDYGTEIVGTTYCRYGCMCWRDPINSGGPHGIDPEGSCPKYSTHQKLMESLTNYC